MSIRNIEIQDSNNNIYYPHTSADVVKYGATSVSKVLEEKTLQINNLNTNKVDKNIQFFNPTLVNGWTNYTTWDSDFRESIYYKDDMGIVHFEGTFTSGNNGYICTLPNGFRPNKTITFPVVIKKSTTSTELLVLQGFITREGNVGMYEYNIAYCRATFNFNFKL